MNCDLQKTIDLLRSKDNILIITHKNPDGDAIGSSFGLYFALKKLGKIVTVDIGKRLSDVYRFIFKDYNQTKCKPDFVVSLDLADPKLLLEHLRFYESKIDLSIDHHASNTFYAKDTLLCAEAASTTEILYDVIAELLGEANFGSQIASCLYLGLTTDTGCFKYPSVTFETHEVAAKLIKSGADHAYINKKMFDMKSKKKLQIEQIVLSNIKYHFNDKCAVIFLPKSLKDEYKVADDELEGLSALPIQIEGVEIGVTIKEKEEEFKVSVRTGEAFDASQICGLFGGGGHKRAAGCTIKKQDASGKISYAEAVNKLLDVISKFI